MLTWMTNYTGFVGAPYETQTLEGALEGRTIVGSKVRGRKVLFLDIDGVCQPVDTREYALDKEAVSLIYHTVTGLDALIVFCSDRCIQDPHPIKAFNGEAYLPHWLFGGQCDPSICGTRTASARAARILSWLIMAEDLGCSPSQYAILDDDRSLKDHRVLAPVTVKPDGPIVTGADLAHVWDLLQTPGQRRPPAFQHHPGKNS